jgi:hypothetical protein
MNLIPVVSSNIKAIGWQANVMKDGTYQPKDILRVEFMSGLVYDYLNVSKTVFEELMASESKGSYINRKIKDKYTCIKSSN